ncbi:MAG: efflux RND transporter periplasmic adaptor subunit [Hyphomicrobiaceae bacterium]
MIKRLVIVTIVVAALLGGLAYFQYVFKPQMIRNFLANAKPPPATISAELSRSERWVDRDTSIGTLIASEGVDIAAQVGGTVQHLYFDSGQTVAKGQRLVELDTDIEKAELASNRAQLQEAELAFKRQVDLRQKAVTSEANLDAARAKRDTAAAAVAKTEATISKKTISAPFAGRLGIRKVEVGQYVSPGLALVTLQAIDPIRVDFPMPEQVIAKLAPGQETDITVDAFPGQTFKGKVQVLDARVAADTRTLMVRGLLPNPDSKLLPGMFANVTVVLGEERDVVTVPRTAVTYSLYGDSVWVLKPAKDTAPKAAAAPAPVKTAAAEGSAGIITGANAVPAANPVLFTVERRFVRTGDKRQDRVEITEGLASGERIATSGQLKLTPGATVRIAADNPLKRPAVRPRQ